MSTPNTRRYCFEMPAIESPHIPIVRYRKRHPVERCEDEEVGDEGITLRPLKSNMKRQNLNPIKKAPGGMNDSSERS